MEHPNFKSFEEFWPYYVKQHSKKGTRMFHFYGTTAGLALVVGGVLLRKKWMLAAGPVVGYLSSWTGHFFVEKNVPATFKNPLWSFRADWVMWKKILDGTMDAEVERILAAEEPEKANGVEVPASAQAN
jgi:hypothetical protein